ncbi:TPA: hypothetical protein KE446_004153 [Citrobacter koseri]|nr:hypothetical protein [Citrobacter koseri]
MTAASRGGFSLREWVWLFKNGSRRVFLAMVTRAFTFIAASQSRGGRIWFLTFSESREMAKNNELEAQRLMLLGAVSTLDEHIRNEIFELKSSLLKLCENASEKEYAMTAISLAALDIQRELSE